MVIMMIRKHYTDVEKKAVTQYSSEGTSIRVLVSDEDGAPNFILRRFEIEPNGKIGLHHHIQEHEIYILSGKGEAFNDDETIEIKENDVLYVPPNEPHGYRNTGNKNLTFLCTIPLLE